MEGNVGHRVARLRVSLGTGLAAVMLAQMTAPTHDDLHSTDASDLLLAAKTSTRGDSSATAGKAVRAEGFADQTSVAVGETVGLAVSATVPWRIAVYRAGPAGRTHTRLIWTSRQFPARDQGPTITRPARRTVTTAWRPSVHLSTRGWRPGLYLLKLVVENRTLSTIPLIVRGTTGRGPLLLVSWMATWQAYNSWGGANLYRGAGRYELRSRAVSFDRPYRDRDLSANLARDLPLIDLVERLRVPTAYATDLDLAAHPAVLHGIRGILLLGHSEYWSPPMRNALVTARNHGVHLAFLGADDAYWRTRTERSRLGSDRLIVAYKSGAEDPVKGAAATVKWEEPPAAQPSSLITGEMYGGSGVSAPMVVTSPRSWLLRDAGVRVGTRLPGLVGVEYDAVRRRQRTVAREHVVAHSPLTDRHGLRDAADFSWYEAPSGALVVDVGTLAWGSALDSRSAAATTFVRRVTIAIVHEFLRRSA